MLLYDHDRTEKIVTRLRDAEWVFRLIALVSSVALFALAGMSAGNAGSSSDGLIGGVVGAAVGFVVGAISMILISAVIEWMCQLLIAHGELVELLKRRSKG